MHDAYYTTLVEELASRGIDQTSLDLETPSHITASWLARAMARELQLSDDPALGISYGLRLNLASHGILGYALMSSRNGDQLLGLLTRYAQLIIPDLQLRRVLSGKQLLLTCETSEAPLPREFLTDLVLTSLISGARALFNRRIPGAELQLAYPRPAYADRYDALKIPVRFNQPRSALACNRTFLQMEISSANPLMAQLGAQQCEELLSSMQQRTGLAQRIRRSLLQARGQFPDQSRMASQLNLSTRTLRRQLEHEGAQYRQIVDEVRFELAQRYLHTPNLSVGQIAELLSYDDPANFRRAFKRWSGVSPQTWRDRFC